MSDSGCSGGVSLAYEKEKRINYLVMAVGIVSSAAGIILYFSGHATAGILVLVAGISVLLITLTVYDVLFKIDIMEKLK